MVSRDDIFGALSAHVALSASDIKKKLGDASKSEINHILYKLQDEQLLDMIQQTPPLWKLKEIRTIEEATEDDPLVIVVNDCGNVHDCMQKIEPYVQKGKVHLWAYADRAFSGYLPSPTTAYIFKATTTDKNSADVKAIWDIAIFCARAAQDTPRLPVQIYFCTKDLQFQSLKKLVETSNMHTLTFVQNWDELKMYIE